MSAEALVLQLGDRLFGIWSDEVVQVLRAVAIERLPNQSPTIEGVINVRGSVVPVLNLRRLVDLPEKRVETTDHIVVLTVSDREVAVRVDRAIELAALRDDQLEQASANAQGDASTSVTAKTDRGLVHIIDWQRLVGEQHDAT